MALEIPSWTRHRVIRSIYGSPTSLWEVCTNPGSLFFIPREPISRIFPKKFPFIWVKVGSDNSIRFWKDVWIGVQLFKSLFPRLYELLTKRDALICDFYSCMEGDNQVAWSFFLGIIFEKETFNMLSYYLFFRILTPMRIRTLGLGAQIYLKASLALLTLA